MFAIIVGHADDGDDAAKGKKKYKTNNKVLHLLTARQIEATTIAFWMDEWMDECD